MWLLGRGCFLGAESIRIPPKFARVIYVQLLSDDRGLKRKILYMLELEDMERP